MKFLNRGDRYVKAQGIRKLRAICWREFVYERGLCESNERREEFPMSWRRRRKNAVCEKYRRKVGIWEVPRDSLVEIGRKEKPVLEARGRK